jgi:hypothetical protein
MKSKYIIDLNGRYDSVVGSVIRYGIGIPMILFLVWVLFSMVACKTVKPIAQTRDSIRVEIRHDSVFVFKHDSIFRDRLRSGDTVYVTVEKFKTLYRDKLVEVHDTISTTQTDTIEVQVVPNYYRRVSTGFWILLAILLALTAFKAYKLYLRIQSGGIL